MPRPVSPVGSVRVVRRNGISNYCMIKTSQGWMLEHRYIMENLLGRTLSCVEVVHHKNGNTADNSADNLELMTIHSHPAYHNGLPKDQWSKHFASCLTCRTTSIKHSSNGLCDRCYSRLAGRKWRALHPKPGRVGGGDQHKGVPKLPPGRWTSDRPACIECQGTHHSHKANGLCKQCYDRLQQRRIYGWKPRVR